MPEERETHPIAVINVQNKEEQSIVERVSTRALEQYRRPSIWKKIGRGLWNVFYIIFGCGKAKVRDKYKKVGEAPREFDLYEIFYKSIRSGKEDKERRVRGLLLEYAHRIQNTEDILL